MAALEAFYVGQVTLNSVDKVKLTCYTPYQHNKKAF